jgi:hypothetical protein
VRELLALIEGNFHLIATFPAFSKSGGIIAKRSVSSQGESASDMGKGVSGRGKE